MTEALPPIERSERNDNAHIFWCGYHEQRRYYRTCLYFIDRAKSGDYKAESPDEQSCANAIKRGCSVCPALAMRREEIEQNQSLYYVQRQGTLDRPRKLESEIRIDRHSPSYRRGFAFLDPRESVSRDLSRSAPVTVSKTSQLETFVGVDMASAVNDLVNRKTKIYSNAELTRMSQKVRELTAQGKKKEAIALLNFIRRQMEINKQAGGASAD
jgi:hypothetical protein